MSLPNDLLDQLLTGYLDDALSADERVRVDQLLESQPEVADELAQLRELRESLKAVAEADSSFKLEDGFADRVLDAAVARAQAEGLADDHPLLRLAEQPSSKAASTGHSSSWRFAGVLIALAASIAIAVFTLRPHPRDNQFANSDPSPPSVPEPDEVPAPDEILIPEVPEGLNNPATEMVAQSDPDRVEPGPAESVEIKPEIDEQPKPPVEAVVTEDRAMEKPDPLNLDQLNMDDIPALEGAIMVIQVVRTDAGRQNNAVGQAMQLASLQPSKQRLSNEAAAFLEEQRAAVASDVSVIYLNVTGTKFDTLYQNLVADEEGIASVQLAALFDAPLLRVVDTFRRDPTTVRHDDAAIELFSDSGLVNQFAHELGEQIPDLDNFDRKAASEVSLGEDIDVHALVLVR